MLLLSDLNVQPNSDLENFRFERDTSLNSDGWPILQLAGPQIFPEYPRSGIQTPEYEYPRSTHYTRMYLSTCI